MSQDYIVAQAARWHRGWNSGPGAVKPEFKSGSRYLLAEWSWFNHSNPFCLSFFDNKMGIIGAPTFWGFCEDPVRYICAVLSPATGPCRCVNASYYLIVMLLLDFYQFSKVGSILGNGKYH